MNSINLGLLLSSVRLPKSAFSRFPPVHWADLEGQLRVQAVRKLLRVFTRTYFVRFFEPSERSEARKSRRISLCSASRRKSPCFRTASVESGPRCSSNFLI